MIERMQQQNEQAEKRARKIGMKIPVPPLGVEIATLLLIFLGVESLISLLLAPSRFNAQGYLHIVTLAAFPLAYGIWAEKKWALYAALIVIEPLLLIYPFIVAFSPYFGIEYNWISVLSVVALNPPTAESELARLERRELQSAVGPEVVTVERAEDWPRAVYRSRVGPELWWPLLLAALLLLFAESFLASSGPTRLR